MRGDEAAKSGKFVIATIRDDMDLE